MQWMRLVLKNHLRNSPGQFLAPNAKTIMDIVKSRGQVKGFENYPTLEAAQQARINATVKISNYERDLRQGRCEKFLLDALAVAKSKAVTLDPCPTGLYAWRTVGGGFPGGWFRKYGPPLAGNQFYTLEARKLSE